jgi:hypothetical protein
MVERTPDDPPPVIVAVVGPSGVVCDMLISMLTRNLGWKDNINKKSCQAIQQTYPFRSLGASNGRLRQERHVKPF